MVTNIAGVFAVGDQLRNVTNGLLLQQQMELLPRLLQQNL
jgi:hypothetical protein